MELTIDEIKERLKTKISTLRVIGFSEENLEIVETVLIGAFLEGVTYATELTSEKLKEV